VNYVTQMQVQMVVLNRQFTWFRRKWN